MLHYREHDMTKTTLCALALLAYLGVIDSASASGTSQVKTGPLVITLTDLDLADGISPSVSFTLAVPILNWTHVPQAYLTSVDDSIYQASTFAEGTEPLSISRVFRDGFTAHVSMTGREQFGTHEFFASSTASTEGPPVLVSIGAESGWYDFQLSPNTALSIEMTAELSGTISPGPGQDSGAYGSVSLGMWLGPEKLYAGQRYGFRLDQQAGPATSLSVVQLLTATYENRSTMPVTGFVDASAGTMTYSGPAPIPGVPEPGSLPTFAAGLGVIAMWARRRQGRAAAGT
jgi:hypothetical protein